MRRGLPFDVLPEPPTGPGAEAPATAAQATASRTEQPERDDLAGDTRAAALEVDLLLLAGAGLLAAGRERTIGLAPWRCSRRSTSRRRARRLRSR